MEFDKGLEESKTQCIKQSKDSQCKIEAKCQENEIKRKSDEKANEPPAKRMQCNQYEGNSAVRSLIQEASKRFFEKQQEIENIGDDIKQRIGREFEKIE